MRNTLVLLSILVIPGFAHASYRDGFFAFGIIAVAAPILFLGIIVTVHYCNKKWFYDRSFTILYSFLWFVFFAISIVVTSMASLDGSDKESPAIIFIGLSIYYFLIVLPAALQYRNSRHNE
jgi:hypothetical protein